MQGMIRIVIARGQGGRATCSCGHEFDFCSKTKKNLHKGCIRCPKCGAKLKNERS